MNEEWKQIKEFGGKYWISSFGRVKSMAWKRESFLFPYSNKNRSGYVYISLQNTDKDRKNILLHRLVAKYFVENPQKKGFVNHKDFNPQNNRADNLEWVTQKENISYSQKAGRLWQHKGEDNINSVLSTETVLKIILERVLKKTSYRKIAEKYKTKYSNVAHIMRGSRWSCIWEELGIEPIVK